MSKFDEAPTATDGGFKAWLHCLAAFLLYFNGWGIINSFGVYQTFYEQDLLSHETPSNVAWIGSLQAFLSVLCGVVAGPLYDHGFIRSLVIAGSALLVSGVVFTSFAHQYWALMITQGLMVGLGGGVLFLPGLLDLASHFRKHLALAQGVATSGGCLGGVIYPIVFSQLQPKIGFGWAVRVSALIAAVTLVVPVALMNSRKRKLAQHPVLDVSAWRQASYSLLALAIFIGFVGFYVPFCYVQAYSKDKLHMDTNLAFYLLPIISGGAFFGRIIPNILSRFLGPLNTLIPCTLSASTLALLWIALRANASLILFCALYGFFSSPLISLVPNIVAVLSPDPKSSGTRMGMMFVPMAFGYLIGNPIAGILLATGWVSLQVFCAGMLLACAGVLVVVKLRLKKSRLLESE